MQLIPNKMVYRSYDYIWGGGVPEKTHKLLLQKQLCSALSNPYCFAQSMEQAMRTDQLVH